MLVIILYAVFHRSAPQYDLVEAKAGTLIQEVSITGSVKAVDHVELSFENGGRIAAVPVRAGDHVFSGQTLLSLDASSDVYSLRQAEATLLADQAVLAQLQRGTRPADLAVLQSKALAADTAVLDARSDLTNKIQDAYTKTDDAVHNYGDQFFDNARSSFPAINITVNDDQLRTKVNAARVDVEKILNTWNTSLSSLNSGSDTLLFAQTARTYLNTVSAFFDTLALIVNSLTPTQPLSQTTITAYRANVSTARSAVNTALTNVISGLDSYNTAVSNRTIAEKNLKVAEAGSAPEEIDAAAAKVAGDQANVDSMRHKIYVSSIHAPFAGVVTRQDGKIGEVVSANSVLVSIIGDRGFQIEANVPEADIAKLSAGQSATVTLDAYGNDTAFDALVDRIDPAETLIDNVATYKVTFSFLGKDDRIRSGMTANIDVLSAKKENVLMIPIRAVSDVDGSKIVRVPAKDGSLIEKTIMVGLKSSDGQIEVLSGLAEGDMVVTNR